MKICFVGDTGSIHTQRWVTWFAERHEVAVVATARDQHLEEYKVATLPARAVPGTRLLSWARAVRYVVSRYRPDVLHCHYINEAGWLGASTRFHPLVVTAWGSDLYRAPSESRLARRLNPWTVRAADWVTCDSFDQASVMRSWGANSDRVSVIGWGVDRDAFNPGVDGRPFRAELRIPDRAPVILSPRQWQSNSNIPSIIAAHASLADDVYLILKAFPGRPADGAVDVERALSTSPARDRVRVVGDLRPDQLPALYAAADVVVSLCTTDGTPASVLESMAIGRPVIALANPSLAEWVSDDGGRLVHSKDPATIAEAANALLVDSDARARAASHNTAVIAERGDRKLEFERMDEIYAQLVSDAHRRRNGHEH
jgi:glycosyltransferase involved in cell wall biosynthesis